jgi:hypothetical protein
VSSAGVASAALVLISLCSCGEPTRDFSTGGKETSTTLFLNYENTVFVGVDEDATRNFSTLVLNQTGFMAYLGADPARASKLDALTDEIAAILEPYAVLVTSTRPATGPYHMVMFTDNNGAAVGCPTCISLAPTLCDRTEDSAVGFIFGGAFGGEVPPHMASSQVISMFGLFGAIPMSAIPGDCMCYVETPCIEALLTTGSACTIGGAGTSVSTTQVCSTSLITMDEHAEFVAVFGSAN